MLVVAGSLIVAVSAQLSFYLPQEVSLGGLFTITFPVVPVTGQTLAVLLVGALLGSWRGFLSLSLYVFEGLFGLPVFAEASFGIAVLLGPTGGYIIGFIVAATLTGFLAERGWDRTPRKALAAMLVGNIAIYLYGLPKLASMFGWEIAFYSGFVNFIPGDMIKLVLAVGLLPAGWWILMKFRT